MKGNLGASSRKAQEAELGAGAFSSLSPQHIHTHAFFLETPGQGTNAALSDQLCLAGAGGRQAGMQESSFQALQRRGLGPSCLSHPLCKGLSCAASQDSREQHTWLGASTVKPQLSLRLTAPRRSRNSRSLLWPQRDPAQQQVWPEAGKPCWGQAEGVSCCLSKAVTCPFFLFLSFSFFQYFFLCCKFQAALSPRSLVIVLGEK